MQLLQKNDLLGDRLFTKGPKASKEDLDQALELTNKWASKSLVPDTYGGLIDTNREYTNDVKAYGKAVGGIKTTTAINIAGAVVAFGPIVCYGVASLVSYIGDKVRMRKQRKEVTKIVIDECEARLTSMDGAFDE